MAPVSFSAPRERPLAVRVPGLDLLRALAIVWVLLFHSRTLRLGAPLGDVSRVGWMGVDLFFALSGYLIGAQWLASISAPQAATLTAFRDFWVRRALRIFPAYLVVVTVYFSAPALREAANLMPLWQFLTFTENLFIDFSVPRAFTHVWSLCVEEHFYLLFPLASLVVLRVRPKLTAPLLLASLVLGGFVLRWWVFTRLVQPAEDPGTAYYERLYYPTWTRLDGLLGGVTVAALKVFRPRWFESLASKPVLLLSTTGVTLGGAGWLFADEPTTASVVLGFPLIALGMSALVLAATQWRFQVPLASAFAAGAYSLYLSHKLAFAFVRDRWGPWLTNHDALAVLAYGSSALLVGAALYWLVERPVLKLRDARLKPTPRVTGVTT